MSDLPKSRPGNARPARFVALVGGASEMPPPPRPPAHLGLRRAAELVEGSAYDLAGKEPPVFISRLIEIAAELDRLSRSAPAEQVEGPNRLPLPRG